MPRRAPSCVRRDRALTHPLPTNTLPRGIPSALARTGRIELHPAHVAVAVAEWRRVSRLSRRQLGNASDDRTYYLGPDARDVLQAAAYALPPHLGRRLRLLIDPLDRAFLAKTLPDPFADPSLPWWRRRLADLYCGRRSDDQ